MIAPGCSWQLLATPGTSLLLQPALGSPYSSWKLLVILGSYWYFLAHPMQLLVAPGNSWQLLVTLGSSLKLLTAPGSSLQLKRSFWQPLVAPGSSWRFRSSSWQRLVAQRQFLAAPMQLLAACGSSEASTGSSGQLLVAPGNSCKPMTTLGNGWQILKARGFWQLLAALGSS